MADENEELKKENEGNDQSDPLEESGTNPGTTEGGDAPQGFTGDADPLKDPVPPVEDNETLPAVVDADSGNQTIADPNGPKDLDFAYCEHLGYLCKLKADNANAAAVKVAQDDYDAMVSHEFVEGMTGKLKDTEIILVPSNDVQPGRHDVGF